MDRNITVASKDNVWHSRSNKKGDEDIFVVFIRPGRFIMCDVGNCLTYIYVIDLSKKQILLFIIYLLNSIICHIFSEDISTLIDRGPKTCRYCLKHFSSTTNRNQHEKYHRGLYNYVCDVCSKGFNNKSNFKNHTLSHESEKQFKCLKCQREFVIESSLKRHTCSDKLPERETVKCEECGQMISVNYIDEHLRHHSGVTYKCKKCGESFDWRSQLKRHSVKCKH